MLVYQRVFPMKTYENMWNMDVAKSLMSLPLKTEKTRKLGWVWDKCVRCHSLLISSDCVHTQIDSHPKGEMIKLIQVLWITMMIYFFAMGESSHRLMLSKGIGCFYPWKIDSKRTLVRLLVEHSETLTVFQVWTSSNLSSLGRFKS
jgi:hypothetical protein